MEGKKENQFIDADQYLDVYEAKIDAYKPSREVLEEFVEAAKLTSGCQLLMGTRSRFIRGLQDASQS